jgi:hypothetical protein
MQISGVSLTLTWPHRLCLLIVLLGATTIVTSFPLSKHTGGGDTAPAFSGLPPSPVEFSSYHHLYKLSHSGCWACATAPAFSGRLVYLQFCEGFPSPSFRCSGGPALFATCLFCYCLLFSFSFFPEGGVSLSRELC